MARLPVRIVVALLVLFGASVTFAQSPSLKGVWKVVAFTGVDGKTDNAPQPSVYIYTDRHYSVQRVTTPRAALPDKATDKDVVAAFGPYVANSGTYEMKGDVLTTRPIVAKNPNVMANPGGGGATTVVKFEGPSAVSLITTSANGKTVTRLQRIE